MVFKRAAVVLVALVLLLGLGGWLVLTRQATQYGRLLVDDANALQGRVIELGAAPVRGNIFDCLGAEADAAPSLVELPPWTDATVRQIAEGNLPLSALGDAARTAVIARESWFERVLSCGRRSRAAAVAGIGPFADLRHGRRQSLPAAMESLASLAPLTLRAWHERGRDDQVVSACVDVLVLTTLWLRLEGLESMLPTLGPTTGIAAVCVEAAARATPEGARLAARRVLELETVAPTYAEVMAIERTQTGLRHFGAWLPDALDAELAPEPRAMTRVQRLAKWDRGVVGTLALRLYWKRFDTGMRAVEAAAAEPETGRAVALRTTQAQLVAPWLKRFFTADPVDLRYDAYWLFHARHLDVVHSLRVTLEAR